MVPTKIKLLDNFLQKYREKTNTSTNIAELEIASAVDVEQIFRKISCNIRGCDKEFFRQSFKIEHFLVIVDGALMAFTTRFAKMNGNSDNFSLIYDLKKLKHIKEKF
jgi:hypothetical protein